MNVHIVFAHPEPKSFNGALRDLAIETLTSRGHSVQQSDLYAMAFDAVCGPSDFSEVGNNGFFNIQAAQRIAVAAGTQAAAIVVEQGKLRWADLLILQFPIWWFGMPSILKGWIDRVFALGVAYGGGRWFDNGAYRGKRALISITTGARADRFSDNGLFGPIEWVLHPLRVGTLNFCGFDTLEPFIAWAPGNSNDHQRKTYLDAWRKRLGAIESEVPQPFRHLSDYPSPAMRDH